MRDFRRLVAGCSIAAILLALCLPGFAPLDCALVEFEWMLLPDDVLVATCVPPAPCDEQPVALLSLAAPRGPPSRHPL